jgi:hypothetical protein
MATIEKLMKIQTVMQGRLHEAGSSTTKETVTAASNLVYTAPSQIINSSAGTNYNLETLWQHGVGGLSDFDYLVFETDAVCWLIMALDRTGTVKYAGFKIAANTSFTLSNDEFLAAAFTQGSPETENKIDQIQVKNDEDGSSTTTTVNCTLRLFT